LRAVEDQWNKAVFELEEEEFTCGRYFGTMRNTRSKEDYSRWKDAGESFYQGLPDGLVYAIKSCYPLAAHHYRIADGRGTGQWLALMVCFGVILLCIITTTSITLLCNFLTRRARRIDQERRVKEMKMKEGDC
jgi:hypothetical protein